MNRPNWIVEADLHDQRQLLDLTDAIKRSGSKLAIVKITPAGLDNEYPFEVNTCTVYYGSLQGRWPIYKNGYIPGVYCEMDNYDCTKYYPAFKNYLLNYDCVFMPYGMIKDNKDYLFNTIDYNNNGKDIFVRPNRGNKIFTGTHIKYEEFDKMYERIGFYGVEPHELCVISSPKNIKKEWRFLVVDGKIITGSEYNKNGDGILYQSGPAFSFAQLAVTNSNYNPDRAWTIDICESNHGLNVLEIGCFSCAGLYAMDKDLVVQEINRIALEEYNEFIQ